MQTLWAQIWKAIAAVVRHVDLRDVFVFGGLGATVYGVAGFSAPAAWIVGGVVLFVLGMKR